MTANVPSTPGVFMRDVGQPIQHRVGAIDRGRIRQLHGDDEIALVLLRNEAGRHRLEAEIRQDEQADIDGQRHEPKAARRAASTAT